jgi:hypothetical protein
VLAQQRTVLVAAGCLSSWRLLVGALQRGSGVVVGLRSVLTGTALGLGKQSLAVFLFSVNNCVNCDSYRHYD